MIHKLKTLMGGVILLLAAVLVSCSKNAENDIVGKWQVTSYAYQVYEGDRVVDGESINVQQVYEFREDGTGLMIDYDPSGTYTFSYTWAIMGDKLVLTDVEFGESMLFDIISISSSSMVLSMTEEYIDYGISYKDVTTITFKKI